MHSAAALFDLVVQQVFGTWSLIASSKRSSVESAASIEMIAGQDLGFVSSPFDAYGRFDQ